MIHRKSVLLSQCEYNTPSCTYKTYIWFSRKLAGTAGSLRNGINKNKSDPGVVFVKYRAGIFFTLFKGEVRSLYGVCYSKQH